MRRPIGGPAFRRVGGSSSFPFPYKEQCDDVDPANQEECRRRRQTCAGFAWCCSLLSWVLLLLLLGFIIWALAWNASNGRSIVDLEGKDMILMDNVTTLDQRLDNETAERLAKDMILMMNVTELDQRIDQEAAERLAKDMILMNNITNITILLDALQAFDIYTLEQFMIKMGNITSLDQRIDEEAAQRLAKDMILMDNVTALQAELDGVVRSVDGVPPDSSGNIDLVGTGVVSIIQTGPNQITIDGGAGAGVSSVSADYGLSTFGLPSSPTVQYLLRAYYEQNLFNELNSVKYISTGATGLEAWPGNGGSQTFLGQGGPWVELPPTILVRFGAGFIPFVPPFGWPTLSVTQPLPVSGYRPLEQGMYTYCASVRILVMAAGGTIEMFEFGMGIDQGGAPTYPDGLMNPGSISETTPIPSLGAGSPYYLYASISGSFEVKSGGGQGRFVIGEVFRLYLRRKDNLKILGSFVDWFATVEIKRIL